MDEGSKRRDPLTWVQAARGFAALGVVSYHLSFAGPGQHSFANDWLACGRLGVAFFFVLSGFLMMFAHHGDIGKPERLRRYARNRFVRIYPIYWLVLAALALFEWTQGRLHLSAADWLSAITLVHFDIYTSLIGTAWTLFHEVIFYMFFAALLISRQLGVALLGSWLLAIVIQFHYPDWGNWNADQTLFSALNLDFFFGIAAFLCQPRIPRHVAVPLVLVSAVGIAGCVIWEHANGELISLHLPYGICFAGLLAGVVRIETAGSRPAPAPLRRLGDASYVLYLVHLPIIAFVPWGVGIANISYQATYPVALLSIVVISIAVHLWIEKPLLRLARHGTRTPGPEPGFALATLAPD